MILIHFLNALQCNMRFPWEISSTCTFLLLMFFQRHRYIKLSDIETYVYCKTKQNCSSNKTVCLRKICLVF